LTKHYFFTIDAVKNEKNRMNRKSQTLSDQGTESHSSTPVRSSLEERASLIGFVEGWTAE
jgi:hypothetical protein